MSIEEIAEVAHQANQAYREKIGEDPGPDWRNSPSWQKASVIDGVKLHISNPDTPPGVSHENWLKRKIDEGWKCGPVKNPHAKEHPCCRPYDDLPLEQQLKDILFASIVNALRPLCTVAPAADSDPLPGPHTVEEPDPADGGECCDGSQPCNN